MSKKTIPFRILSSWANLVNQFYYPHRYYIGRENIPADGVPVVLAGNHQNCMMDPLNTELALSDRKCYCVSRTGLFKWKKMASNFLTWLGLVPFSRMGYDGLEDIRKVKEANKEAFATSSQIIAEGNTMIVFPEARHQNKRWLGYFSLGYLTMAFQAAERLNYEKEVYIVPFAHHYGNYFHPFYDFVLQFGKPIPLSPFYEQYQKKPRSTTREVNSLVEQQIRSMMLDINDLDHYKAIDALRESNAGKQYAVKHGFNPKNLVEKLKSDQLLVEELKDPAQKELLDQLQTLEDDILAKNLNDQLFDNPPRRRDLLLHYTALLLLSPLFLVSLPAWPVVFLPRKMYRIRINGEGDEMFRSTWNYGMTAAVTLPLCWWLPTLIFLCFQPWLSLIYFAIFPLLVLFSVFYVHLFQKTLEVRRFTACPDTHQIGKKRQEILWNLGL